MVANIVDILPQEQSFLSAFQLTDTMIRNLNPPAPHIPEWFTKELTELGGKSDNGRDPQLRIVWGGSATTFWQGRIRIKYPRYSNKKAIGWETINTDGTRELLPLSAANNNDGKVGRLIYDWLDIGKPFFFMEEWVAPEIACEGWEAVRWQYTPPNTWIDKLGPAPREGLYRHLFTLATDDGEYMPPDEQAMVWIKKMLWLQRQEPLLYSKRERPPACVVENLLRARLQEVDAMDVKYEEHLTDLMVDRVRRSSLNPTSYASISHNRSLIITHK